MNTQKLSFESMPPIDVPYRFFVTAPIFVIATGFLILFSTPGELSSRWSLLLIAATHGLSIGFMLMVMLGALFQILPVILGTSLPRATFLSKFVHFFLVVGNICLMAGIYLMNQYLLIVAVTTVSLSIVSFLIGLSICIPSMRRTSSSLAIILASLGLFITFLLGIFFVVNWVYPVLFPGFRFLTNIHLLWGFIGWTFLLITGVSFQFIPMFYVTKDYPKWLTQFLPPIIFIQLIILSLFPILSLTEPFLFKYTLLVLVLTTAIFPVYTIYVISKRKRKAKDTTLWFWKTAMAGYLIATMIFLWILFFDNTYQIELELVLAHFALFGFAIVLITGMLLKIMPFLVWLNIQQKWIKHPSTKMPLSNMQQVIPNSIAKRQYLLYIAMFLSILLLMSGFQAIWFIRFSAVLLIVNFYYLLHNLVKAKKLYNGLALKLEISDSAD